ncbi:MAG: hypothetical protein QOH06_4725 [Acidobacteriota bacterium]|nr:hypothetical protein [Acidobacteriota bacterium]
MTNMPVTVVLREGAEGEPEWTLSVRGRAEQARVELRTARARMVIAPETLEPDVLAQVLGTADELEAIQGRLRRLANEVPEPPDEMLDHEMPYDLHTELLTTLECVAEDDLGAAIGKLRTAAAATPEQLRRLWEEDRFPEVVEVVEDEEQGEG